MKRRHQPFVYRAVDGLFGPLYPAIMDWTERDVRATKRKDRGGVYYVVVPGTAGWVSSGLTNRTKAVEWALVKAHGEFGPDVTLGEYTKNFFLPGVCPRIKLKEQAGGKNIDQTWANLRQLLETYIWPRWSETMLVAIRSKPFFDWLTGDLQTTKKFSGSTRPLSAAQRNKIHSAMTHVYAQAMFDGIAKEDPLAAVPWLTNNAPARGVFSDEEMKTLFPMDEVELERIWMTRWWAVFFMAAADTGMRPHETLALRWQDWHPAPRAFVVSRGVNSKGQVGGLKTERLGVKKKVALVGLRTASLLEEMRKEREPAPDDLVFPSARFRGKRGLPMRTMVAYDHFLASIERAGVPRVRPGVDEPPRTQYCLRHKANTGFRTDFGDEAAQLLMGHMPGSGMTEHYDHPDDAELVARALRAVGRG